MFWCLLQDDLLESSSDEEESGLQDEKKAVFDVEDLGNMMNRAKKAKVTVRLHEHSGAACANESFSSVSDAGDWFPHSLSVGNHCSADSPADTLHRHS